MWAFRRIALALAEYIDDTLVALKRHDPPPPPLSPPPSHVVKVVRLPDPQSKDPQ